jgi:alanine racemase
MAVAAVKALIDEIDGHAAPHSEYMFRPELIVRGSTAVATDRPAPVAQRVPVPARRRPARQATS